VARVDGLDDASVSDLALSELSLSLLGVGGDVGGKGNDPVGLAEEVVHLKVERPVSVTGSE
jgi:hypothetical protein